MAPSMDVQQLGNLLRQLGFRVVSLIDLTREEMMAAIDMFVDLLDKGVYGLFYYAGHGYERSGRNYLVAVDAPPTLPDQGLCEDAEAFEVQDGGKSTGIFTKYLNKHILKSWKVTHVLEQVSEDLGLDPLVNGRQAVEIKHTLKEPRSLTDRIRTTGHTRELHLRDKCWRQANALPGTRRLSFGCGVQVDLSFSALFSNVMVVFGTVKTTDPKTQDCSVTLSSRPTMDDIFSGPGRSEVDSLLDSNSDSLDCVLRLCSLQNLQQSLVITVDLHYTHLDSKLRLTESQKTDIG
ncbi:hypothetical protein CRUP_030489, partial [Coryphaenoides rupestris]